MKLILLMFLPFATLAQNLFREPAHKARLGEIHYGSRVGGLIAQEGRTVEVMVQDSTETLRSIQVCLAKNPSVVRGFRLEVQRADGSLKTVMFGNSEGAWAEKFVIEQGRKLVGISGACGWFIDNLRFHFDDRSTTPLYGGSGGDTTFQLLLTQKSNGEYKGRFMGFWGSSTQYLETLGLIFYPYE